MNFAYVYVLVIPVQQRPVTPIFDTASHKLLKFTFDYDLVFSCTTFSVFIYCLLLKEGTQLHPKLADGSIRERAQGKYNCYQRGQHLQECDGQALYLAERVDRIVVAYADELFSKIKSEPYDKSIEQRIRQQGVEHNKQKQAFEKNIKAAQYKQQRYEDEVLKCLERESVFSQEMLARLIAQAEAEVNQAKEEYANLLKNNNHRATVQ